ncbi:MAG: colanic acid biosynthesis glycosyltransferase WcaL, partial [Candidatus Omnitrophica bacterium]|nr:colanic acid biosynthesis glycosyltransferase WcaL [Candidatus Omnitrophota bacterium]
MRIAFIVNAFPILSETFILNQITGLIDRGHEVVLFSGCDSQEETYHPEVDEYDLLGSVYCHNERPRNPIVLILKAIVLFLTNFHKNPRTILRSLNFFKYGRDALSLTLFYKTVLFIKMGEFDIIQCHYGPNGNIAALLKEIGIPG